MRLNTKGLLLPMLLTMAVLLTSCCCKTQNQPTVANLLPGGSAPSNIRTSLVQVTGPEGVMTFQLNEEGQCEKVWFGEWNNSEKPPQQGSCEDGYKLQDTMFCTPPSESHPANVYLKGTKGAFYCAPILYATEGMDIRFRFDEKSKNRICKYFGGDLYCYP